MDALLPRMDALPPRMDDERACMEERGRMDEDRGRMEDERPRIPPEPDRGCMLDEWFGRRCASAPENSPPTSPSMPRSASPNDSGASSLGRRNMSR